MKIITIISLLLLASCSPIPQKGVNEYLLVYATINDSIDIYRKEKLLIDSLCIQIKIDTVLLSHSYLFKNKKYQFYKDHIFSLDQVFKLKELKYASQFTIKGFDISYPAVKYFVYPPYNELNCASEETKKWLTDMYRMMTGDIPIQKRTPVFFHIDAINSIDGKVIHLNNIRWYAGDCYPSSVIRH